MSYPTGPGRASDDAFRGEQQRSDEVDRTTAKLKELEEALRAGTISQEDFEEEKARLEQETRPR